MALGIHLEWTPNPDTLKYVLNCPVLPLGGMEISSMEEARTLSPLAEALFGIEGVAAVTLGVGFISIRRGSGAEWGELNEGVLAAMEKHLGAGGEVLTKEGEAQLRAGRERTEIEARIEEVLEREIGPALARDGGGIALERFEEGVAYVHMRGACAGCPSARMTLKMGIEVRLKEAVPEVQEVVAL